MAGWRRGVGHVVDMLKWRHEMGYTHAMFQTRQDVAD
jgi:hypothetical protein